MEKIKENVSVYKISDKFFIRSNSNIYEIQDTSSDKINFFLECLEKGLVFDAFQLELKSKDREDFITLYYFLKSKNLLISNIDSKNFFFEEKEDDLKKTGINIIGRNKEFNKILKNSFFDNKLTQIFLNCVSNKNVLDIYVKDATVSEKDMEKKNKNSFNNYISWLPVDLSIGDYIVIGPLIIPHKTACYQCYVERRLINKDVLTSHDLVRKDFFKKGNIEFLPLHYSLISSLIVDIVRRFFLGLSCMAIEKAVYVDISKFEIWQESLLRYPKCYICSKN